MPAVQAPALVLVTGASGFIAAWVINSLLEHGFRVRGTVRSVQKGKSLVDKFKGKGDFEYVIVEDIAKEGAFDEAVKGVDAVEHIASPVIITAVDPQDLIKPALNGTLGILSSVLKHGSNVKRVVITSSTAAILSVLPEPHTYNENDWNEGAIKEVEEKGKEAVSYNKYRASKTLAEKAAWAFVKENKPSWDLVVLNPPWVYGPTLHDVSAREALNTSAADLANLLLSTDAAQARGEWALTKNGSSWVHVQDLAEAHARALERAEAGGERIIVSEGPFVYQEFLDIANKLPPSLTRSREFAKGFPQTNFVHLLCYDASKAARILGLTEYKSKERLVEDVLQEYHEKGW